MKVILVHEIIDGQVLQALLVAYSASKVCENCIDNLSRRALEVLNMDIFRRSFLLSDPFIDRICGVQCEARVHLHLVQPDSAPLDVLGALRDDFGLVRQEREREVVDAQGELVRGDDVENCDLPLGLAVLQLERKHAILRKFFAVQIV